MISAILNSNIWLVPAFILTACLLSGAMLHLARRLELSRTLSILFGVSLAGEVTATLYPTHAGAAASGVCTINRDIFSPVLTQQGLMNVAMFVPFACFAALLFNSAATSLAGAIILSGSTELLQASVSGIGRSCTTEDVVANGLGAACGVALAVFSRRFNVNRRGAGADLFGRSDLLLGGKLLGAGAIVLLVVGAVTVTPVFAEVNGIVHANSAQKDEAEDMVRKVFGEASHISSVQRMAGGNGQSDQVMVTLDNGFLSFVPGGEFVTGSTNAPTLSGVKARPIKSDRDAIEQATAFVRTRFPWALNRSTVLVHPTAPGTGQRTVAWRQRVGGVLMPLRMDVVVEPNGRISAFTGTNQKAPSTPPAHKITAQQARAIAEDYLGQGTFKSSEILVQKTSESAWETRWAVNIESSGKAGSAAGVTTVIIHGVSGKVIDILQ